MSGGHTEAGPGEPGSVIAAGFEINGQKFVALNGGPQFTFNAVDFLSRSSARTKPEVRSHYWETLVADGGEAGQCGWFEGPV